MKTISTLLLLVATIVAQSIRDEPFNQEYHTPYPIRENAEANNLRSLAVGDNKTIWAAGWGGLYNLVEASGRWSKVFPEKGHHSSFAVATDRFGTVWLGAWDGLYRISNDSAEKVKGVSGPISVLEASGDQVVAMGPKGAWLVKGDNIREPGWNCSRNVRGIVPALGGGYWIATGVGLFRRGSEQDIFIQDHAYLLSADISDVAYSDDNALWIGGLGGVTIFRNGSRAAQFLPRDGIPSAEVTCLEKGPDGRMWVGTTKGIARYNGKGWSVRHSRRWLLDDNVRDIVFDCNGTAWIATARGLSAIRQKPMTMKSKADHFQRVLEARHMREPGLVEKCRLAVPGDTTSWEPRDDDNDGEYTGMFLAMESYRYAVTKSPHALANARRAFRGLKFLQEVTDTPGFFARTVIPADWTTMADPNREFSGEEWAEVLVGNAREKYVPQRWRRSRNGKWLWKGDTSSDEMTGHMYGYLLYFDLAADEKEKKIIADHVCKIVDYIIDCGYVLKDIDGTHTKWAVWSPDKLNNDPDWSAERYINSVELLSFLKLAWHVSGEERYQQEYEKLLYQYKFVENIVKAKHYNPAFRTHIDDELLAITYPCLLFYEKDPALLQLYRESVENWFKGIRQDRNAFFNFLYNAMLDKRIDMNASAEYFRDASIDLVRWRIDNSRREDLEIVRRPELDSWQTSRLVPPSERCMMRLDKNPWLAVQGDGGHTESDGVWYLLPYWMGRYYGYINTNLPER